MRRGACGGVSEDADSFESPRFAGRSAQRRGPQATLFLAIALLAFLAVGLAACGEVRPSASPVVHGRPPAADELRLIVSREFGSTLMRDEVVPYREGLDVMGLLAERAEVETAYGGGFVSAIDGVRSTFGGLSSHGAADWFYWVDGVMAEVGAADYDLKGGETVWWDYHEWSDGLSIPATLSAFPAPWRGRPVALSAERIWPGLQRWVRGSGLTLVEHKALNAGPPAGGLVVATAEEAAATPWLSRRLTSGGDRLVSLVSGELVLRSPAGAPGPRVSAAALALADERSGGRPLLVLLVDSPSALTRLLGLLRREALAGRVAVALLDERLVALPWRGE